MSKAQPDRLDRAIYAKARGRGKTKSEAARLAGSQATTGPGLVNSATRLEDSEDVQKLIKQERAAYLAEVQDSWDEELARARAVLNERLNDSARPGLQFKAMQEAFRIAGIHAPQRREVANLGLNLEVVKVIVGDAKIVDAALDRVQAITGGSDGGS